MAGARLALLVSLVCGCVSLSVACNEAVCASVVSKCMLLQACRCNLRENCSCCKECWNCLGPMYSDCCSCVGMCPKPNDTYTGLGQKSHVERLEPFDELFRVLTNEPDLEDRWTAFEYPITFMRAEDDIDLDPNAPVTVTSITTGAEGTSSPGESNKRKVLELKCRVAYMSQCMSWNKCKESCSSMGADSYRWFHDGCCECVGYTCVNYGIDESRCSRCPLDDEEGTDDDEEGEEEDDSQNGTDYSYEDESGAKSEEKADKPEKKEEPEGEIERAAADEKESPDNPIDENG